MDIQQEKIARELIRNPRASDNCISKRTGIPVMSVNRKRKKMEEQGLLQYYTHLDTTTNGTGYLNSSQLYVITYRSGITKESFLNLLDQVKEKLYMFKGRLFSLMLGEQEGRLAVILTFHAKDDLELLNIFAGKLIKIMKENYGQDCIHTINTMRIIKPLRVLGNYLPGINIENGRIKDDWPDELIMVN